MTRIDLYPNPAFVEAVRKDGYNKFGFDVFLVAYTDAEKEEEAFEFISNAIQATDKDINYLKDERTYDTQYYKTYSNTIEYLLKYYKFLFDKTLVKYCYDIGASYTGGIVQDYIEAVNSKKSILYTEDRMGYGYVSKIPPLPTEISSWFPDTQLINYYTDHALLTYIGGPNDRLSNWVYNMILVSMEKDKGFNYSSQKIFMNWDGNPLNNKTD